MKIYHIKRRYRRLTDIWTDKGLADKIYTIIEYSLGALTFMLIGALFVILLYKKYGG